MTTPTTRSINGATYVPIDWNNSEDPGSAAYSNVSVQGFVSPKIYDSAKVVLTLRGDAKAGRIVADTYRQQLLTPDGPRFESTDRNEQEAILSAMETYQKTGSYQSLVSGLKNVELGSLKVFARNWLNIEKKLLERSISDVMAGIKAASDLALRSKSSAVPSPLKSTKHSFFPQESNVDASAAPKRRGLAALSADDVRRQLWDVPERRNSAVLLSGYLAPNQNLTSLKHNTFDAFLDIATKGVAQEAAEGLATDAEMIISDLIMTDDIFQGHTFREAIIISMLDAMELEPAGYLVLERLDFTPVGYVRGELVYSIPLTPNEKVTVSHSEWSNTSEEYLKVVQETIEEERQKAVSENTELAESIATERQVNQRGEASADAVYKGTNWSIALSGGWSGEWNNSRAIETSSKRSQEITSKAASRSKTEHKISFRIARETHTEDEQLRVIENATHNPVRWDFHRLMKKWQIDLYNLGERLTWDIVLPEPGRYLLQRYVELQELIDEIEAGDPFDISVDAIAEDNYMELAAEWGAVVKGYPEEHTLTFEDSAEYPGTPTLEMRKTKLIEVPENFYISDVTVIEPPNGSVDLGGANEKYIVNGMEGDNETHLINKYMQSYSWTWKYLLETGSRGPALLVLAVTATPTEEAIRAWRMECWNRISEAARARWMARLEGFQARRDRLIEELMGKDSLKLRQMEREEIMKAVLRWMLGPEFNFYQEGISRLASILVSNKRWWIPDGGNWGSPYGGGGPWGSPYGSGTFAEQLDYRQLGLELGPEVRFLHQAIEWENINWITYPYFWSDPQEWAFKQAFEHPDFYHRNFLRAGWTRVVLTIRPGFEWAWLARMAGLDPADLNINHPYLSLAREIEARANTTYAYTPVANRDELQQTGEHVDRWFEYTPTGALDVEEGQALLDQ